MKVFVNGDLLHENKAKVSVFDRGLQYGDGVFETIRAYDGIPFRLTDHVQRLYKSAATLRIRIPLTAVEIEEAVKRILVANNLEDAYVKIIVTGGTSIQKLTARKKANVIVLVHKPTKLPNSLKSGVKAVTFDGERFLAEAKSCNMLLSIFARQEAENRGAFEAILVNRHGHVTEGAASNVFLVKGRTIYTPKYGFLAGIARNTVMRLLKRIHPVVETNLTRKSLFEADECFLTNTMWEVVPVIKIDSHKIGSGAAGKITRHIRELYRAATRKNTTAFRTVDS